MTDCLISFGHLPLTSLMGILFSSMCVCARHIGDRDILLGFHIPVVLAVCHQGHLWIGEEVLVGRCSASAQGLVLPGKLCC